MSRNRQIPSPAASGSQVIQNPGDQSAARISGTLTLRGENNTASSDADNDDVSSRRIRWSKDVVDNEGMGKKSSKVCCIYHKPRPVGESSSESESSDSSSSDTDSDSETDHHRSRPNHSQHALNQDGSSSNGRPSEQVSERGRAPCCATHHGKGKRRKPSPNAYEKMPKTTKGDPKSQGT